MVRSPPGFILALPGKKGIDVRYLAGGAGCCRFFAHDLSPLERNWL
jgi:hypothetical protein